MSKITTNALLLAATLSLGIFSAQAQQKELPKLFGKTVKSVNPENGLIRCATNEYEEYLQEQNPNREKRADFENWLAPKIAESKARRMAAKSANDDSNVIYIPVVVHVIHNGDAIGVNENITDEQVLSQIEVLNQDFRKMLDTPGYNENPVGADMEIEFKMAKVDPDGNPTNGIDRVKLTAQSQWSTIQSIDTYVKPATYWDPSLYFNIWVVNYGETSSLLGYAQFPSSSGLGGINVYGGEENTDGLVVGYKYFGSYDIYPDGNYGSSNNQYRYGRTATHEIGHCFGLIHIWGDNPSCTVSAGDSSKDYCLDTPAQSTEHYDCYTTYNSCTTAPGYDMVENYMDYTNDQCMNIFTQDQKNRVWAVMENSPRRAELKDSTVWQTPASTETFALNGVNLYPNPASTFVTISASGNNMPDSYTVFNNLGQVVSTVKVSSANDLTVNTASYSNGIYFIKVDKGSKSKTLKFVKN